ncbi:phosphoheptose isomerase [Oleiphilus sp. HI0071]|nr:MULTISPECIES: D-sedoheptulose 7-phosphate isomerase [unclassified Oleiphilus]KZY71573.1 phosphoheptose isomerase [Oleiphilus sp. HI0065]KZY82729.1 phosphoheptose isomerase [Oleiphilus sp. HI0071]KZZ05524.1 phosphoheptose isomerase [Oleiphilus sp. HI0073]KZZ45851.1 phosphoheptose isomerase [Oleiphilus sp. HI0118]KZZ51190.1 phosphoheptose isomerase [Oleiphilus sp. HI0122]KZZ81379.1 phosphoheptose isomerase [Oleiphilus sp. HI0133]
MSDRIKAHIERSIEAKQRILSNESLLDQLDQSIALCVEALRDDKKILFAGNGGSASDAQHLAAELVGRYRYDRESLAAIAITTDTSALTAIGNDYGYEDVFSRQLSGLGQEGDVLVAISTSGNSGNIVKAIEVARKKGIKVIGMSGEKGKLKELSDTCLAVPAPLTATIQEAHIMLGHILCDGIEQALCPELPKD